MTRTSYAFYVLVIASIDLMFTVVVVPCTLFLRISNYLPFNKFYVQEVFYHSPKDMCQIFTVFLLIFIAEVSQSSHHHIHIHTNPLHSNSTSTSSSSNPSLTTASTPSSFKLRTIQQMSTSYFQLPLMLLLLTTNFPLLLISNCKQKRMS